MKKLFFILHAMTNFYLNKSDAQSLINVVEKRTYYSEIPKGITEYLAVIEKYNSDGRLICKETYAAKNHKLTTTEYYFYDKNGYMDTQKMQKGKTSTSIKYTRAFDSNGRITQVSWKGSGKSQFFTVKYESDNSYWESHHVGKHLAVNKLFNVKGHLIKEYNFDTKSTTSYTYDTEGNLVHTEINGEDDFKLIHTFENAYDDAHRLLHVKHLPSNITHFYNYDSQNRVQSIRQCNAQGLEIFKTRFEYK
jgi:YD repeat-containing protein